MFNKCLIFIDRDAELHEERWKEAAILMKDKERKIEMEMERRRE